MSERRKRTSNNHQKCRALQKLSLPLLDNVFALPDHGDNGPTAEELAQLGEEGPLGKIVVMLLRVVQRGRDKLHGNELIAPSFKASDDGADKAPLDSVWLEHDVAPLGLVGKSDGGAHGGGKRDGARAEPSAEVIAPCVLCRARKH